MGDQTDTRVTEWEQLAAKGDLDDALLSYVRRTDTPTFTEIQQRFAEFMPTEGSSALHLPRRPNTILWAGMSEELSALFVRAFESKTIIPMPTIPLVYMIDGGALNLPIAKRVTGQDYKKEHWLPTVLRPRERAEAEEVKKKGKK
jgi:hypothetical protein